jgi:hypothetical protein
MPNVPNYTPLVDNLGHGADRTDGTGGRTGTPTQDGQIVVFDAGGGNTIDTITPQELDDSPIMERAEQCTVTHHVRTSWTDALNRLNFYGRGTMLGDSYGNFYRVLSSSIQRQPGGKALLTVVSESMSFDVPPDEYSLSPVKLGLDILKHPRYFYALMPTNQIPNFSGTPDTSNQIAAKQAIIRAIQAYRENPFIPTDSNINAMTGALHDTILTNFVSGKFNYAIPNPNFSTAWPATGTPSMGWIYPSNNLPYPPVATNASSPNPINYLVAWDPANDPGGSVNFAFAAAMEMLGKLWRMEDTPPVSGVELVWSEYSFRPQMMNLGGYIEDPTESWIGNPGLPDYFYSPANPPNTGQTVFDNLSHINPQCYSITGINGGGTSISWLRDADTQECIHGLLWKHTRKWLGAPIGAWDAEVNSRGNRPTTAGQYSKLILA